jgi:hypothetical protein
LVASNGGAPVDDVPRLPLAPAAVADDDEAEAEELYE